MAKIGDTVRFLNAVGGGTIVRIEGRMAYVRDPLDGFEIPVMLSECVAVPSAGNDAEIKSSTSSSTSEVKASAPAPTPQISPAPARKYADNAPLTAALIFEPHNIRQLSQTAFDLYLVNDSGFNLCYTVASHDSDSKSMTLIGAGVAEPDMQVFLRTFAQADLNSLAVMSVQLLAYKPDVAFDMQPPVASETRLDLTRFAKLHCFTSTAYSDVAVLTVPIVTAGKTVRPLRLEELVDEYSQRVPEQEPRTPAHTHKKAPGPSRTDEPEVVDLHIHELIDSTAGLQPADMLACQLREFDRHMEQAIKTPGKKIIFIHGKGEGVLRAALLDRLRRRWPACEANDASFREYGFGATQITIHR